MKCLISGIGKAGDKTQYMMTGVPVWWLIREAALGKREMFECNKLDENRGRELWKRRFEALGTPCGEDRSQRIKRGDFSGSQLFAFSQDGDSLQLLMDRVPARHMGREVDGVTVKWGDVAARRVHGDIHLGADECDLLKCSDKVTSRVHVLHEVEESTFLLVGILALSQALGTAVRYQKEAKRMVFDMVEELVAVYWGSRS